MISWCFVCNPPPPLHYAVKLHVDVFVAVLQMICLLHQHRACCSYARYPVDTFTEVLWSGLILWLNEQTSY